MARTAAAVAAQQNLVWEFFFRVNSPFSWLAPSFSCTSTLKSNSSPFTVLLQHHNLPSKV
jgi:hypothetical protein